MPKHQHVWSAPNAAGFRHCLQTTCGAVQRRAGGSLFNGDSPARGIPQDHMKPQKSTSPSDEPAVIKKASVSFDPTEFEKVMLRMNSGMMSVSEAIEGLARSARQM